MDLLVLTKYRITVVALFTGYTAVALHAGPQSTDIGYLWPLLVALFLLGGSANTLNQVFERDKDAAMDRTKARRPLPAGRITVGQAVVFAVVQLVGCVCLLWWSYRSPLAISLALFTLVYYSFFYTLYLKPRHWLNIVIGGVPGAMGPLIAWAAVANEIAAEPLVLFLIIFLWTPPHVWALAIKLKDDYAKANIPMLPVVKGVDETTRQIFWYTVVMVIGTLALPACTTRMWPVWQRSLLYFTLACVLGAVFLGWSWLLWRRRPVMATMPLFRFSIVYISALFLAVILDSWAVRP
jgi:protoheme IX farnesyltransferase